MPRETILRHRYPPVGRCIYCPADAPLPAALSDEHIIASGLGGNLILRKASCMTCAAVTSGIERTILAGMWGEFRAQLGLRSKKRRRSHPTRFQVGIWVDGIKETRDVDIRSLPAVLSGPMFSRPRMLRGLTHEDPPDLLTLALFNLDGPWSKKVAALGTRQIEIKGTFAPTLFCRMLAKIAHSYAVAKLGLDGFTPYLRDAIRNGLTPEQFVGGAADQDAKSADLHDLYLDTVGHGGRELLMCRIRLFGNYGAPTYEVVVGEPLTTPWQPSPDRGPLAPS